jgi:hypothetical protein
MLARRYRLAARVLVCALAATVGVGHAQPPARVAEEYDIKAHFLCLVPLYVYWPKDLLPEVKDRIIIGVLGKDPFDKLLEAAAAGRTVDGKKIVVRRFKTVADFEPCHVVFVAPSTASGDTAEDQLKALQAKVKSPGPVLIADTEGLAQKGAFIRCYVNEEKKLRFEVNVEAAKRGGIQFKPEFLRLAQKTS